MSPSTPIAISLARNASPSPSASTSTPSSPSSASGLYVPVHKRTGSDASGLSTRSPSPVLEPEHPPTPHPLVYSREALLALAPLAQLPAAARESIRATFPELVLNRKQKRSIEFHAQQARAQAVQQRRTRPVGRAPERRRNASKVVDEANWRAERSRVALIPIAV